MTTLSLTQDPMPRVQSPNWVAIAALLLTVVGWAFSALAFHDTDTAALKERVTKVETKLDATDQRLERMEVKIDRLLERKP